MFISKYHLEQKSWSFNKPSTWLSTRCRPPHSRHGNKRYIPLVESALDRKTDLPSSSFHILSGVIMWHFKTWFHPPPPLDAFRLELASCHQHLHLQSNLRINSSVFQRKTGENNHALIQENLLQYPKKKKVKYPSKKIQMNLRQDFFVLLQSYIFYFTLCLQRNVFF